MPAARQSSTEQLQRTHQPHKKEQPAQTALPAQPSGDPMIGRIPVLDVRPLVDCGKRPAKAVEGETFRSPRPSSARAMTRSPPMSCCATRAGTPGPGPPCASSPPAPTAGAPTSPRTPRGAGPTPSRRGATPSPPGGTAPDQDPRRHRHRSGPRGGAELYERAAADVPKRDGREAVLAAVDALRDEDRVRRRPARRRPRPRGRPALARHPLRELVTASRPLPLEVERHRALFGSWYEFFPRSEGAVVEEGEPPVTGTFRHRRRTAARRRRDGLRRRLSAADPPHRHHFPQGPNNTLSPRPDDVGRPLGHRLRRRRPRRGPPRPGHARGLRPLRRRPPATCGMEVALDFALQCSPDHPWVASIPSGSTTARRHHRVRREPAEEVPGHLPARLRQRHARPGRARPCGCCASGWTRACGSSASTTRTPSRSSSGRR